MLDVWLELSLFFLLVFIIKNFKISNNPDHKVVGLFKFACSFSQFLHEILLHRLLARPPLRAWHFLVGDLAIPFTRIVLSGGTPEFPVNKSRNNVSTCK